MKQEASELIPISMLNAYVYCPRRFYYEYVLGEMIVNEHVFEGKLLHEQVDTSGWMTRGEKIQLRHLYLCAPQCGLIGYGDLIEVEGSFSDLAEAGRQGKVFPVEYKKGKSGKWSSDQTQLCAQALALEEILVLPEGSIQRGYIWYVGSARRDEILIGSLLREETRQFLQEAKQLTQQQHLPLPISNRRKCLDCSLEPLCMPREMKHLLSVKKQEKSDDDSISY